MVKFNYTYDEKHKILECYVNSVSRESKKEQSELNRLINGSDYEEDELFGEPLQITIDLVLSGGIKFFYEELTTMGEHQITIKTTYVQCGDGSVYIIYIPYQEFKTEIFLKYILI